MVPNETYVVIGSNCFTGSHIVDAFLEASHRNVVGISRSPEYRDVFLPYKRHQGSNFRFCQLDLVREFDRVLSLLDEVKARVVVNVAALSEVGLSNTKPIEYFEINTLAVVRLCNHLRRRSYVERYVHISSAEIFGSSQSPVTEEMPFNPSTPYAVSKAAADMYLATLQKNFGFPVTLIRSTNVYGKHQQLFKIIPRTIIYLKKGHTIELHGGGQSQKSFVHIRDVVHGLALAVERGHPGTYHFTVQSDQTVADIVRYVCELMGHDFARVTRNVDERLGQDARYLLDCSKAKRELGWSPQVKFEEGIQEVIEWINRNWDHLSREPLVYQHKI